MDTTALERFVLATDRTAALAGLVAGSDDWYRFHALEAVHARDGKRLKALIAESRQHSGSLPDWADPLLNRLLLIRADEEPEAVRSWAKRNFDLECAHQAPTDEDAPPSHASSLPADLFAPSQRLADAGDRWLHITAAALDWALNQADTEKLGDDTLRDLLKRVESPDYPALVRLIVRDLQHDDSGGFGSLTIHLLLTLAQLHELAGQDARLRLRHDARWVAAVLARMRPEPLPEDPRDPAVLAWLQAAWAFVEGLPPAFASLQAHVLHHLLHALWRADRTDGVLFLRYLQLPRRTGYMKATWLERQAEFARLDVDFRDSTGLPAIGDDTALVRDHLAAALAAGGKAESFATWLDEHWLRRTWAALRILHGGSTPAELAALASRLGSASDYQALVERVDLELSERNHLRLSADEPVELRVSAKNVPRLLVKIFRINTINHVLAYGHDIDGSLDLDGLVPNRQFEISYDHSPQVRHDERIAVPDCAGAGTWVVELIGRGVSSRAIIRKGALQAVWRLGAAGQVVTILDAAGHELRDAALLLGGREFRRAAGDDGVILPFTAQPGQATALLVHGEVATPWAFAQLDEVYTLDASLHLPAEDLRGGGQAQVAIRARLHLHGHAISLDLLEDAHLNVVTTDLQGVEIANRTAVTLTDDGMLLHRFSLPVGTQRVAVNLGARLKRLDGTLIELGAAAIERAVATIDAGSLTEQVLLLRHTDGGTLLVTGKNGEPRPGRVVTLQFTHRWYGDAIHHTLQSDAAGEIQLGELTRIVSLQANLPNGFQRNWSLAGSGDAWPQRLCLPPGQGCELPWSGPLESRAVELLRLGWNGLPLELFSTKVALRDGLLTLPALPAGHYRLRARSHDAVCDILVAPAFVPGWLRHADALLRSSRTPLRVDTLTLASKRLRVRISGQDGDCRVLITGSRLAEGTPADQALTGDRCEPAGPAQAWYEAVAAYQNGRDLGDEYRYIVERARTPALPGIMLARPGLLLNPWAIRSTSTCRAEAGGGSTFGAAPSPACAAPYAKADRCREASEAYTAGSVEPTWDFLAHGAVMLSATTTDGTLEIDATPFAGCTVIEVLVLDDSTQAARRLLVPRTAATLARRDLRLMRGLDPAVHVAQRQEVTPLPPGSVLEVQDPLTARLGWIPDRLRAISLLRELADDTDALDPWDFLGGWESLGEAERRDKLGEFASHELHLFLARRDPSWFTAIVLPCLRQKRERTFVDRWLLGEDLRDWLRPATFATLNALEQVLLAEALGGDAAKAIARSLADRCELVEIDPEERHRRFLTMLGGEGGDLGDLGDGGGGSSGGPPTSNAMLGDMSDEESERSNDKNAEMAEMASMSAAPPAAVRASPSKAKRSRSADLERRGGVRPMFRQVDRTMEWGESHWWKRPLADLDPEEVVPVCAFWADAARWIADGRHGPFLSPHIDEIAAGGHSSILGALAFLDLPPSAAPPQAEEAGSLPGTTPVSHHSDVRPSPDDPHLGAGNPARFDIGQRYRLATAALLAQRQTLPCPAVEPGVSPLLINQYVLRLDDSETWVNGAKVEKPVTGEFLANVVYASVVVITNPGLARIDIDLLSQIPRGSLPCEGGARSRCQPVRLEPGSTERVAVGFYFPIAGDFAQFPAHASQAGRLLAHAPPQRFHVLERPSAVDASSWAQVAAHGTPEQVLAFVEQANPGRIDLDLALWRCRDKRFWSQLVARLRARCHLHADTWSYAAKHKDDAGLGEWLELQDETMQALGDERSAWLRRPERIAGGQHLEYGPLINARAHRLGEQARILNDRFCATWRRTLERLAERPALSDDDRLVLAVYLLLQDRHAEAATVAAAIAAPPVQLPMDYLRCFLAFVHGRPGEARAIAERHLQLPLRRWRERFADVCAQLDELEGRSSGATGSGDGHEAAARRQAGLAAEEPSLALRADAGGRRLRVVSRHLAAARVNYYPMDLELLFSRQPFMQGDAKRFACIAPAWSGELALGAEGAELALPERFAADNVMVEVVAGGLRAWLAVYANRLRVQVQEAYGQLQVLREGDTPTPLPATYVKAFARMRGGEVHFYKDGYSDLRGRFDFASLSTDDLDRVERFALLLLHREHGGLVLECAPPPR